MKKWENKGSRGVELSNLGYKSAEPQPAILSASLIVAPLVDVASCSFNIYEALTKCWGRVSMMHYGEYQITKKPI